MHNKSNLKTQDLLDSISLINKSNLPTNGCIKVVYVKQNGGWQFLLGSCVFMQKYSLMPDALYENYAFISRSLNKTSFSEFLEKITGDGYLLSEDFPPLKTDDPNLNWRENTIPSHCSSLGLPVKKYTTTISAKTHFIECKLIAYGEVFYLSSANRIKEFLGLNFFHGDSDGRKGELSIEIEDRRGKILLKNGHLTISEPKEDLFIVGQINNEKMEMLTNREPFPVDDKNINEIELWLITRNNEIVDYYSSSESAYQYPERKIDDDLESLKDLIHKGESETCEFKPYITVQGDRNNKSSEIDKTVCAFSNQAGGVLFIGVNDEAEVVGFKDSQLTKDYSCGHEEAIQKYEEDIRFQLKENITDNQCFETRVVTLYSEKILVINISKTKSLNYLQNKKQAYIRKGASSMKITPDEIKILVARHSDSYP